jgi:hypothetical protein
MSVRLVGLLVAGLLSCTPVMAGNFVIGGSVGIATGGEDVASLNEQLEDAGFTATASTSGDIRTSYKVSLGYHLDSKWGLDLAYVDLGEATVSFTGIEVPIDELLEGIGDIHPRSAEGARLSLLYQYELNKSMHVQFLLGVFDWETSYSLSGADVNGNLVSREITQVGTSLSTGIGLVHRLTNDMSWHIDWDFYSIDNEPINVFYFGVSYKINLF